MLHLTHHQSHKPTVGADLSRQPPIYRPSSVTLSRSEGSLSIGTELLRCPQPDRILTYTASGQHSNAVSIYAISSNARNTSRFLLTNPPTFRYTYSQRTLHLPVMGVT